MSIAWIPLPPKAPSVTSTVDGRRPPLTEPGGIIHRIAINIAPLSERESVQSTAASSFTAPECPVRRRRRFTDWLPVGAYSRLEEEKKKCVYGYLTC